MAQRPAALLRPRHDIALRRLEWAMPKRGKDPHALLVAAWTLER